MQLEPNRSREEQRRSWRLFQRIYRETLRQHRGRLVLALICMIAVAIASSAQTYLMGPLIDKVFIARNGRLLWLMAAGILAIFAIRSVARYLQEVLLVVVGQRIVAETQDRLFQKLLRYGVESGDGQPAGALAASFIYDANMMRLAVCDVFLIAGKDTLTVLSMLGLMAFTNWKLALICMALPILSILPMQFIGRHMRRISLHTQTEVGVLSSSLTEAFQGGRTVKAFGLEGILGRRVADQMALVTKLVIRGAWIGGAILPIVDGLGGLAVGAIIFIGGWQVIAGNITPGALFVFVGAVVGAYASIPSLSKVNSTFQTGLAAAERVFALMDREPSVRVLETASPLPRRSGALQFDNVSFSYERDGEAVLKGVSFTAHAGRVTALVGPTGAGKSTIFNLLARFYDPTVGRVLVNDVDVRTVTPGSLRDAIALVSQDITMFDETIAGNIRYGRLGATDAEVEAAAAAAGVLDFLVQSPLGLATPVGENGLRLSGGQRQRIAIARALLRDAPILLLDEATSAQDPVSERRIQAALEQLMKGRTTLVIAHRLATVRNADLIHVLDQGTIVESGAHQDLINRGGLYAQLQGMRHPASWGDHSLSTLGGQTFSHLN